MDVALNDAYMIIPGCSRSTNLTEVRALADIEIPDIRREDEARVEKQKVEGDVRHVLFGYSKQEVRLKSKKSFMVSTIPDKATNMTPELPPGEDLDYHTWKILNRLETKVGASKKWGYVNSDLCNCDAERQGAPTPLPSN